jgi:hypothetical protein
MTCYNFAIARKRKEYGLSPCARLFWASLETGRLPIAQYIKHEYIKYRIKMTSLNQSYNTNLSRMLYEMRNIKMLFKNTGELSSFLNFTRSQLSNN